MLLLPSLPTLWASALALQMVVPLPPGQNGQPRDSRPAVPEATGTAIVRGRVVTGDGG